MDEMASWYSKDRNMCNIKKKKGKLISICQEWPFIAVLYEVVIQLLGCHALGFGIRWGKAKEIGLAL